MAGQKIGTLAPIGQFKDKDAAVTTAAGVVRRGNVQTVCMDVKTLKALKYASIERGISQNEIMLTAIRRDPGHK